MNQPVHIELKDPLHGKLYITTLERGLPEFTTDLWTGAGFMEYHLEVDGKIKGLSLKVD